VNTLAAFNHEDGGRTVSERIAGEAEDRTWNAKAVVSLSSLSEGCLSVRFAGAAGAVRAK
jgi:hypothetical protein